MSLPLISIVMPVYNAEKFLLDAISSVQAQTYTHWQLIIVDDNSTDESRILINEAKKHDARIKAVYLNTNGGVAAARNEGIELSRESDFLAFLDADDVWMPTKLTKQVALATRTKSATLFYSGYDFVDVTKQSMGVTVKVPKTMSINQAYGNHLIWTSTVLINLHKIDITDVFMADIGFGEDITTWWRLLSKYGAAYGINEPLALYRRRSGSLSSNKISILLKKWNVFSYAEELKASARVYYYALSLINAARKRV